MVRELRSHFLFLGDQATRPAQTLIVACGRLPEPIRMRREKSMNVTRSLLSIVDDDESVRESLPDLLKEFGFAVRAFSSAEALNVALRVV